MEENDLRPRGSRDFWLITQNLGCSGICWQQETPLTREEPAGVFWRHAHDDYLPDMLGSTAVSRNSGNKQQGTFCPSFSILLRIEMG
jgi:hypothetical protein